ncbi:MAG TPA: DUF5719 family protein [Actinomycetota bacterium]|nr:DUF5719 family protein [Actinomycetota bacterium]
MTPRDPFDDRGNERGFDDLIAPKQGATSAEKRHEAADAQKATERRAGRDRRAASLATPRERRSGRERREDAVEAESVTRTRGRISSRRAIAIPEGKLAATMAVIVGLALILDLLSGGVSPPEPRNVMAPILSRALFCPPPLRAGESSGSIAVGGAAGSATSMRFEPVGEKLELQEDRSAFFELPTDEPVDVVGLGGIATASSMTTFVTPISGAAAAGCSTVAATRWHFAEGSSILGADERIIVYNPLPSEAVVRVVFYTPSGVKAKANLAQVPVPARSSVGLAVNDFLLRQRVLGATVTALRGRVVAWRALLSKIETRPRGGELSLGARTPATKWYFPDGGLGAGYDERISILNTNKDEAVLSVALSAGDEVFQPPKLMEIKVPPRSARSWSLAAAVGGSQANVGGVAAVVRSLNGVPVVAERSVSFDSADQRGLASEVGATRTAQSWWLGPATSKPSTDSVIVLSQGTDGALVSLTLIDAEGPRAPGALQDLKVGSFGRLRIPISKFTGGKPVVVVLTSTGPVVAERVSYSAASEDVASVMGTPLLTR